MKKSLHWLLVIFIITAITITIGFVACKEEAAETTAAETTVGETTAAETTAAAETTSGEKPILHALSYVMGDVDGVPIEKVVMNKFEEDTGIRVISEVIEISVWEQTKTAKLSGGADIDLVFQHPIPWLYPLVEAGYYMPLEDLGVDWSFAYPTIIKGVSGRDGKIYIPPTGISGMMLFLNKQIMEENGWETPTDYDSFINLCQQMLDKGIVPFNIAMKTKLERYQWFAAFATRILYKEPDFWDKAVAGTIKPFEDSRVKLITEQIVSMWEKGYYDHEASPISDRPMAQNDFIGGKHGMFFGFNFSPKWFVDAQAQGFDYIVTPIPMADDENPVNVTPVNPATGYAVVAYTKKVELCKIFQEWWLENVKSGWINETYGFSPANDITPTFKLYEKVGHPEISDILAGPTAPFVEALVPSVEIINFYDNEMIRVFNGEINIDTCLENCQTKWEEIIASL